MFMGYAPVFLEGRVGVLNNQRESIKAMYNMYIRIEAAFFATLVYFTWFLARMKLVYSVSNLRELLHSGHM